MEKKVLILVFLALNILVFANVVSSEEVEDINKAFECLDNKVDRATSLTLEEAIFSALVDVPENIVEKTIDDEKSSSEECWPKSSCNAKRTGQVLLAKWERGENVNGIAEWLKSKNSTTTDLKWYLQVIIDNSAASTCGISFGGGENNIQIDENDVVTGSDSSCLRIDSSGYKLEIDNNCVDREFVISCDQGFKTNLLYEKSTGGTIYISPNTHGVSSNGNTREKITAQCFKVGSSCDYEGSLWATLALNRVGADTKEFVPYLIALAPDNERFFPSAFLLHIIGRSRGDDQYGDIIDKQGLGGIWRITNTPNNEYYDTSLGILSLGGADSPEVSSTMESLFDLQTENGCWNSDNIRDSAFIIYSAGWLRAGSGGSSPPDENDIPPGSTCAEVSGRCGVSCGGGESVVNASCTNEGELCCLKNATSGGGGTYDPNVITDCIKENYYCSPDRISCIDAGGNSLNENIYACEDFVQSCCTVSVEVTIENCFERGGQVCKADEACATSTIQSSDGACCLTNCEFISDIGGPDGPGTGPGTGNGNNEGSNLKLIIIILIILIILVVLAIIFRDKLRVWWYKVRGKAKSSKFDKPSEQQNMPFGRRPPPSFGFSPNVIRRPIPRAMPPPAMAPRKASTKRDKEMEETLEKLKKISG